MQAQQFSSKMDYSWTQNYCCFFVVVFVFFVLFLLFVVLLVFGQCAFPAIVYCKRMKQPHMSHDM